MLADTIQTPATQSPQSKNKLRAWLDQPNNRNIVSVLALGFFFIIIMVAVLIVQRQLRDRNATAPNAPASQPEAAAGICSLQFTVPPATPGPLNFTCTKSAYSNDPRNGNPEQGGRYYLLAEKEVFRPGELVVFDVVFINNGTYTIDLEMVDSFADRNISNFLEFVDSECGVGAFNPTTNTLTCQVADVAPQNSPVFSAQKHRSFRMRVKPTTPSGTSITNTVVINQIALEATPPPDSLAAGTNEQPRNAPSGSRSCRVTIRVETPPVSPTPTPTPPVFSCNSICKSDAQCQTANSNYFCYYSPNQDSTTGFCRLRTNPTSNQCLAATPTPTPSPTSTPRPTATPSPTATVTPSPTTTPSYACNSGCSTDAQCQGVNAGYICHPDLKVCRLDTNRNSSSCQAPANSYACNSSCTTNAQCQTANGSYICSSGQCRLDSNPAASNCQPNNYVPPTPTVGCNQVCSSNADCSNPDHICSTTGNGNRCRLADYTNSESCTKPQTVSTPGQPTLPQELPQTGAFDDFNLWIKAGLAALGIGAALLLLL